MSELFTSALFLGGVAAIAAYAQAVSGFGFALLAVPLAMPFLGVQQAITVATLLGCALSFTTSVRLRSQVEWRPALTVTAAAVVGIPIGLAILITVDTRYLALGIGLLVLATVALMARRGSGRLGGRAGILGAGLLSGVLLSSSGMNGPPLVIAFQSLRMSPQRFRASLQVTFTLADVFVLTGFALVGTLTWPVIALAALASPALALGWWLGDRTFHRLTPATFRRVVLVMLCISGCVAITQALWQLFAS